MRILIQPLLHTMCVVQPVVEAQKQTEEYGETEQQTGDLDWGASAADPGLDMARYGPFNNPQKIVGSCNLGNFGNFWHEMANSKIAKSVI